MSPVERFPRPATDGRDDQQCGYCGGKVLSHQRQQALVRNWTLVETERGQVERIVVACGPDHLNFLIERSQGRSVDAQLWFGRLCRASAEADLPEASVDEIGRRAGLSPQDLADALRWNSARSTPDTVLPGGQSLSASG